MSFQKDLSKRSLPLKALGLFFFRCCSSTSLARAHQSFKRAAWGQRLLVVEMGDFDPFQWSKGWQLRFPAKGLKNPYTSPSLQIVYCNLYTYYMLYIAIYVHCVHIHLYRPYPSMSAIYLPKFFFPEVLRNSVWFDGSKCDLDQSDGPLHQQNSMGLSCQLHTVETLGNLLDDRKLTDCFTGYFQEVWTCSWLGQSNSQALLGTDA